MPTTEQRDAAAVRVFPPAVPLVTVLAGVGLNYVWPIDIGFTVADAVRYGIGGVAIIAAFLGLGLWSVVVVRRTGQTENPWKPTSEIVAHGPFRLTRNPMYLQMVIISIGFAVLLWNVWILLLTPACAWVLHTCAIRPEEAYLERKFGDSYRNYKRRVRRWI